MENQHRKINGYRELTQEDIDLMNNIKAVGETLLHLQAQLVAKLCRDSLEKETSAESYDSTEEVKQEYSRFCAAEPFRWAAIGKTDIQTGVMALVRAVAQPEAC